MLIPDELTYAIKSAAQELPQKQLSADAQRLSLRYRTETRTGERLISTHGEAVAYAITRMPATYGAAYSALEYSVGLLENPPTTLLDVGAGTGAASWAASVLLDLERVVCFEREEVMLNLGRQIMSGEGDVLSQVEWVRADLLTDAPSVTADLVVAAYVFNEMTDRQRTEGILKLWNAANRMLLLIEPGTSAGYAQILQARELLLNHGGRIAAPCPHESTCMLPLGDWCHFSCRVPRSSLHRILKDGDAPYEDEKFTYLAVVRGDACRTDARVLRHPLIEKGRMTFKLCTETGIHERQIRKRDGDLYKCAKKIKWGDSFPCEDRSVQVQTGDIYDNIGN